MSEDEKEPCLVVNTTEDCEFKICEDERQPCLVNKHSDSVKSDEEIESFVVENKSDLVLDLEKTDDESESCCCGNKGDICNDTLVAEVKSVDLNDTTQDVEKLNCESIPESDCQEITDRSDLSDEVNLQEICAKKKV